MAESLESAFTKTEEFIKSLEELMTTIEAIKLPEFQVIEIKNGDEPCA